MDSNDFYDIKGEVLSSVHQLKFCDSEGDAMTLT